jgi:phosphoesterase RecJ-like protein
MIEDRKALIEKASELISGAQKICITSHKNPDGDAIGSALGLYHILRNAGKKCIVVLPDSWPKFYDWMPSQKDILIFDKQEAAVLEAMLDVDLTFYLDYNGLKRVGDAFSQVLEAHEAPAIMIDHHREPEPVVEVMYSFPEASSTSELVFDFAEGLDMKKRIDLNAAKCLYAGIITDTGSFRFSSTSARTHEIAAFLMERGVNPAEIHQFIFDANSEMRLKLLGYALFEKMRVFGKHGSAFVALSQNELRKFHYKKGDTEGLVNYPLSLDNVYFSTLITEREDQVRLSFRSQGDFDVNEFARAHFNGGGHKNAAGGMSTDDLRTTVDRLVQLIRQLGPKS